MNPSHPRTGTWRISLGSVFALQLDAAIRAEVVVDWHKKEDVKNAMKARIDDLYFGESERGLIRLYWKHLDEISAELLRIAKSRL